jgi:NADH:ubiquinone oxidoreductase subunit 5 (subunit L)/multisubunit Na+/H+ antiporter MnhA subunit
MLPFALVGLHFHSCLFLGQLVAFFMLVLVLADSLLLLLVGWEGIGSAPLF